MGGGERKGGGNCVDLGILLLFHFFLPSILPTHLCVGVCEGLLYAQRVGLDLTDIIAAVGAGAAGSFSINNLGPRMVRRVAVALAGEFPSFLRAT